jgi:hypothetical protein
MSTYTITPYDLYDIGRAGHGRIGCTIVGYWSHDPITLYIDRVSGYPGIAPKWNVTVSHSSGGRDKQAEACDMKAAINFADCMRELAIIGRDLPFCYGDTLESGYQTARAERKAEDAAALAAAVARVDADPEIGMLAAKTMLEDLIPTKGPGSKQRRFFMRGTDSAVTVTVKQREKTKFYLSGEPIARKDLIAIIGTKYSQRPVDL